MILQKNLFFGNSITNGSRVEVEEEYCKGGTKLSNSYFYQLNDKGMYKLNDEDKEKPRISSGGETYFRNNRVVIHIPENALKKNTENITSGTNKPAQISLSISTHKNGLISPFTESLPERLSDAFMYNIKKIEFAGRKCYVIQIGRW